MKKLLDLSDECVKSLSKRAIDENTDFKNLAQDILEREANPNGFEKNKELTDCKKLSTQKYIKEMENYAERVSLENMETMLQEIGLKLDLNPNNYALYYFNDMNDTHYYEMTTQPLDSKKISAYNVMSEFYQKHFNNSSL